MFKNSKAFSSFSVNDIKRAKDFYGRTLGLEVNDGKMPGILNIKFAGGTEAIIYSKPNHTPATFTVLNFNVKSVEETVTELNKKGIEFEKYNEANIKTDSKGIHQEQGIKCAWFRDPAGNILCIMQQ